MLSRNCNHNFSIDDDSIRFNNHVIATKRQKTVHPKLSASTLLPEKHRCESLSDGNGKYRNDTHSDKHLEILFWHTHGAVLHQQVNESYI